MSDAIFKEKVGPYTLVGCIGDNRSGAGVYEAQEFWGKRVALKLLSGEIEPRRYKREVDAYARLDHPGLLELLDHGIDPERGHYLVTRLVEGQSIRQFAGALALSPEAVLVMAIPLLEALEALHRKGFVHRDLKPENLMIDHSGRLIIVDLGLTMQTDEGQASGSVAYRSPEQIQGQSAGRASDVWSMGVVLYELLCGRRPFERATVGEETAAIVRGEFPPLDQLNQQVPATLATLVHACLQPDPAKRPSSAADLLSRMKKLVAGDPDEELARLLADPQGYLSTNAPVLRLPRKTRRRRFPWSWVTDFVGVVVLAVLL